MRGGRRFHPSFLLAFACWFIHRYGQTSDSLQPQTSDARLDEDGGRSPGRVNVPSPRGRCGRIVTSTHSMENINSKPFIEAQTDHVAGLSVVMSIVVGG